MTTRRKKTSTKPAPQPRNRTRLSAGMREKLWMNVLFTDVPPRKIVSFLSRMTLRRYKTGEVIFNQSTKGRDLYLIIDGTVRIRKVTKHGFISLLAVLHERDFFGELSMMDRLPRSARAEAASPCTIGIVKGADVRSAFQKDDILARNILHNLVRRLRTMDDRFVDELDRHSSASETKVGKLQSLVEASRVVNSTLELNKLLDLIVEAATNSIRADRGTLYLIDHAKGELWSKVAQGNNMVEIRLPVGKGLAGHVAKSGETISIADAYNDPRFNPEIDKRSGYLTRNVLCMPLRDKTGAIIGVFQLLNKRNGAFTHQDESFIEAFSIHAAIAIENARMAQEMARNESLSAVGRMASTVIHDIKNPMAAMRMYAQVIKGKLSAKDARMADDMMHEVDRFVAMTQEILDFSRGTSESHLETVNLADALQPALRILEANLSKRGMGLTKELTYSGNARVDIDKLERVFFNLAGNAADAMAKGGTLTLRTEQQGDDLVIVFRDTGTGMPESVRSQMFEPFFTHGKPKGTGLGLAIVKRIIDDHGGRIEVTSEVGKGTSIAIRLPMA